ncbi:MAG: hypothetical protein H0U95_07750 [Bacteroidetes bacterium]|nr:hypothetical protein [Bacteroidota bacterium]
MKNFETEAYTMAINDDLLIEFKVKKNVKLQAKDIWESRDQSVNYMPGKKFFVLFEVDENFDVSVDARRAGASEEYSRHVAAVALCSNRLHEKIIGNLFLKINNPIVPTRFFDDRESAITWLKLQQTK